MADTQKQALGRLGEDIAADYLEKNGYRIVRRNQRFGKNELDYIDIAFPVVHGTNVEDGTLQGYLQMFNIPYVGCDVLSSAVGL